MQKNEKSRVYAIVDASDERAVQALKIALCPYFPKYRKGKTVVIGGVTEVLFVEFRKREEPIFDIMKNLADRYNFYPFYVVEEHKENAPKKDKYGNKLQYFVVDAAMADVKVPAESFDEWLAAFRAEAKKIHRENSVFLKMHVYYREEDGSAHVLLGNTENTNRQAPKEEVILGENGWKEAVEKMAEALGMEMTFKKIRYKYL